MAPAIPETVAVLDSSREDVGDGLDATMRVPREARQIVLWDIVSEIVEEKKWIEVRGVAEAECAAQMNARALESWFSPHEPLDGSNRHEGSPVW
jgi:hypothetical protein